MFSRAFFLVWHWYLNQIYSFSIFFSFWISFIWTYSCAYVSVKGLGLIPGVVGRFDSSNGFRVPHIGWNALQIANDSEILDDIGNRHVYFVHSYRAMPVCFPYLIFSVLQMCTICIWSAYLKLFIFFSSLMKIKIGFPQSAIMVTTS